MRRLIINADDFGLTPGVNRAIVEAHGHGMVTSATLMANASAFQEAVSLAQKSPRLSVGCHVVLVDGAPLLAASHVSSLLAGSPGDLPRFGDGLATFALPALSGRLDPEQIEAEATAQIRKLQSAGLALSHLDTHKHTHMFPVVLRALLKAARTCGIHALRNPFEPIRHNLFWQPRLWKRWIEVRALGVLARGFREAVDAAGMLTPDGTLGIVATGSLDGPLFHSLVDGIPEGTWELVCHPGYNDASLDSVRTRLRHSRATELTVLTSSVAREALLRRGIQLISYGDLVSAGGGS